MAYGGGFWWHPISGKKISVHDHAEAVKEDPKRFGLTKQQVDDALEGQALDVRNTELDSPRGRLIHLACKHGWVRVRNHGQAIAFQFAGGARRVVAGILKKWAEDFGYGTEILLSDFATGQGRRYSPQELRQAFKDDAFSDYAGEKKAPSVVLKGTGPARRREGIPRDMPDHVAQQRLRDRLLARIGPTIRQYNDDAPFESLWIPRGMTVENATLTAQSTSYQQARFAVVTDDIEVRYPADQQGRVCEHLWGWEPIIRG